MFRSSTIIRELALNLAKVIFMLKHSVKLRRYLLCGCVAGCRHTTCRSEIYVYFNANFHVFFKIKKVHLLVSEHYIDQNARRNDKKKTRFSLRKRINCVVHIKQQVHL